MPRSLTDGYACSKSLAFRFHRTPTCLVVAGENCESFVHPLIDFPLSGRHYAFIRTQVAHQSAHRLDCVPMHASAAYETQRVPHTGHVAHVAERSCVC